MPSVPTCAPHTHTHTHTHAHMRTHTHTHTHAHAFRPNACATSHYTHAFLPNASATSHHIHAFRPDACANSHHCLPSQHCLRVSPPITYMPSVPTCAPHTHTHTHTHTHIHTRTHTRTRAHTCLPSQRLCHLPSHLSLRLTAEKKKNSRGGTDVKRQTAADKHITAVTRAETIVLPAVAAMRVDAATSCGSSPATAVSITRDYALGPHHEDKATQVNVSNPLSTISDKDRCFAAAGAAGVVVPELPRKQGKGKVKGVWAIVVL